MRLIIFFKLNLWNILKVYDEDTKNMSIDLALMSLLLILSKFNIFLQKR